MWICWAESIIKMFSNHIKSSTLNHETMVSPIAVWFSDGRIDEQKLRTISKLPLSANKTVVTDHFVFSK